MIFFDKLSKKSYKNERKETKAKKMGKRPIKKLIGFIKTF